MHAIVSVDAAAISGGCCRLEANMFASHSFRSNLGDGESRCGLLSRVNVSSLERTGGLAGHWQPPKRGGAPHLGSKRLLCLRQLFSWGGVTHRESSRESAPHPSPHPPYYLLCSCSFGIGPGFRRCGGHRTLFLFTWSWSGFSSLRGSSSSRGSPTWTRQRSLSQWGAASCSGRGCAWAIRSWSASSWE